MNQTKYNLNKQRRKTKAGRRDRGGGRQGIKDIGEPRGGPRVSEILHGQQDTFDDRL